MHHAMGLHITLGEYYNERTLTFFSKVEGLDTTVHVQKHVKRRH